jgi:hypothetical protein
MLIWLGRVEYSLEVMTPIERIEGARRQSRAKLALSGNQLMAIPDALAQLTNLQTRWPSSPISSPSTMRTEMLVEYGVTAGRGARLRAVEPVVVAACL